MYFLSIFYFFLLGKTDFYGLNFIDFSYLAYTQPYKGGNFGISIQQLGTKASGFNYLSKETSISFSQAFSLIKDRNSTLILGYTFNFLNYWQGKTSGTLGDGSNGLPASKATAALVFITSPLDIFFNNHSYIFFEEQI